MTRSEDQIGESRPWDHSSHPDFFDYYANESQSEATLQRFRGIQKTVLRVATQSGMVAKLCVGDVGCGAGTQSRLWAELGHSVSGVDVNEPLIRLAQQRAVDSGLNVKFEIGSATHLPWSDGSMDICLVPELLEHVREWQLCVNEAARVVRPGGILFLSTTNVLCPKQQEFTLPGYSWYPGSIKRYFERLAVTSHPAIANYAKYPAVNWFSFYSLRDYLKPLGFHCMDRFDLVDVSDKGKLTKIVLELVRRVPVLRFMGHIATPSTYLVAVKSQS